MASTIWKGHISFGLVSIPVKLVAAARNETISFNQLHRKDNSRLKQVMYCQAEDKPVPKDEIVRGYEYEKGKYVVLDDEDIKKIQPSTAKVMEILEFVKMSDVDPVYLDASYYVQPDDAGEKPYTLLFEAMKETGYASVAKLTMHNREHTVLLRTGHSGILLHTLYYQKEVRATEEFRVDISAVKPKELEMAVSLIKALEAEFNPEAFHDSYRDKLHEMIDARAKGDQIVEVASEPGVTPVTDLMAALKRSLATARKPPSKVTEMPRKKTKAAS